MAMSNLTPAEMPSPIRVVQNDPVTNITDSPWDAAYHLFWNEWFWLPNNLTWADMKSTDQHKFPERSWLLGPPIFFAIFLIPVRIVLERYIWAPIGRYYGLKDTKRRPEKSVILENFARENKSVLHPSASHVAVLAKSTGWRELRVERWFALKRELSKPGLLTKFNETCWRLVCYSFLCIYGIIVMGQKWWMYDADNFVIGWPDKHYLDDNVRHYFMFELGFYISLAATVMFDVRRKDFVAMSLHHFTTIVLLTYAWLINATRIGAMIMILFDPADVLLEMAKLVNYLKRLPHSRRIADILFVAFAIVWFLTRVVLYLTAILYRTLWKGLDRVKVYPGYFCFNGMLVIIYILQLYWSVLVWQAVWRALKQGDLGDTRSDDEMDDDIPDDVGVSSVDALKSNGTKPIEDPLIGEVRERHCGEKNTSNTATVPRETSRNGYPTADNDCGHRAKYMDVATNGDLLRKRL